MRHNCSQCQFWDQDWHDFGSREKEGVCENKKSDFYFQLTTPTTDCSEFEPETETSLNDVEEEDEQ